MASSRKSGENRLPFSREPEFTMDLDYPLYAGARPGDKHPLKSYTAVLAAAALLFVCVGVALLLLFAR
jgi:hypothetical protein